MKPYYVLIIISMVVILGIIEDIARPCGDTKFYFQVLEIFHSFTALSREIFLKMRKGIYVSSQATIKYSICYIIANGIPKHF